VVKEVGGRGETRRGKLQKFTRKRGKQEGYGDGMRRKRKILSTQKIRLLSVFP